MKEVLNHATEHGVRTEGSGRREGSADNNHGGQEIRPGDRPGKASREEGVEKEAEGRTEERVRLNLGAGEKPIPKFVNVDLRPLPGIDIVCDVRDLPFGGGIFHCIIADDILEHLGRYECTPTLREWHRVLCAGGEIRIKVPNLSTIATRIMCQTIDGQEAARLLFAQQDYPENLHKNGFTPNSLRRELQGVKFKGITVRSLIGNDANNMEAVAGK